MLTFALDPALDAPLYEQLYTQIRRDIASGALKAGEKLPSKRALAAHLKVSMSTVEGAYGQLLAEGYLRSEAKRGYFVQPMEPLVPQAKEAVFTPSVPRMEPHTPRYDFSTGAVDAAHFPFATWAKLMRQVLTREDSRLLSAIPPQGVPELQEAIVGYLHDFRGVTARPEQVVVGAGSEYLTGLLFQLLGREGGYAVEDPGYPKVQKILAHEGALVCPIPMDEQGMRVDALRWSGARVAHVTPSHQFPLGTVMPVTRRQELLRWAGEAEGRYIIEDDYDSEFRYSGRPIPALQSLDDAGRVVYLSTFAQSLAPSLRIGFLVLPDHLLERYRRDFLFYASTVPSFEQYTLAQFLSGGHFERHVARMRLEYKGRMEALRACVRDAGLSGGLSGGEAGLHLLLRLDAPGGEAELVDRARRAGVGLYPLSDYYFARPPADYRTTLVMGFARMRCGDMAAAFRLLKQAWEG